MNSPSSVEELRRIADEAMRPVVGGFESVALVGFPDHSNVGDSAIWLGELAYLKAQSVNVAYSCSSTSYRKENLERHTDGDTPILIHGGGYFGDIWPTGLDFMLQMIEDFPDRPIVVMPQTIHFQSPRQLERARRIVNGHPVVTVCVRDQRSAERAAEYFDHPVVLTPDSAVFLDSFTGASGTDILYIAREDREAATNRPTLGESDVVTKDWLGLFAPTFPSRVSSALIHRAKKMLHARIVNSDSTRWLEDVAASARNALARRRLERGVNLLASAEVIVTDRLHVHILCVLMDKPHVLLDNSYGKVRTYFETWSQGLPQVWWAPIPGAVAETVQALREQAC